MGHSPESSILSGRAVDIKALNCYFWYVNPMSVCWWVGRGENFANGLFLRCRRFVEEVSLSKNKFTVIALGLVFVIFVSSSGFSPTGKRGQEIEKYKDYHPFKSAEAKERFLKAYEQWEKDWPVESTGRISTSMWARPTGCFSTSPLLRRCSFALSGRSRQRWPQTCLQYPCRPSWGLSQRQRCLILYRIFLLKPESRSIQMKPVKK